MAFRAALEARLLAHSRATGVSLARLRKQVVFDRLLARLLAVAPGRWLLKGGFALDLRLGMSARSTRDVDLGRSDTVDQATADLVAAQTADLDDFFVFRIERTDQLDDAFEGAVIRFRVAAELAGRPFEIAVVDVGFGDPLVRRADLLPGTDLLAFAGVEPIRVPALPLEQHIAEKLHAYTRSYGAERVHSTRVKDLVDIALISGHAAVEAGVLRSALRATFASRATHPLPGAVLPPPADWRLAYRKLADEVGIHLELAVGHAAVASFLDPILGTDVPDVAVWDHQTSRWRVPGTNGSA